MGCKGVFVTRTCFRDAMLCRSKKNTVYPCKSQGYYKSEVQGLFIHWPIIMKRAASFTGPQYNTQNKGFGADIADPDQISLEGAV